MLYSWGCMPHAAFDSEWGLCTDSVALAELHNGTIHSYHTSLAMMA